MNTIDIDEVIGRCGIVPVVKLDDAKDALPLADALIAGGLPLSEITFRTDAAEEAIRITANERPDMLVGAGTVLSIEQADKAIAAGAKFIVSPGLNPVVVKHCQSRNVPIFPGVCTPTEIEAALGLGLTCLKFFPAESYGGLSTLKALCAPYGDVRFMPTGGINTKNVEEYLSFPKIVACGGSWMVAADLIASAQFDKIADLTREAVTLVAKVRR